MAQIKHLHLGIALARYLECISSTVSFSCLTFILLVPGLSERFPHWLKTSHQPNTWEGVLKFLNPKSYKMEINGEGISAIVIQLKLFILHLLLYLIMLQFKFQLEYSYKMTYDAFKQ